jgi:hypothetical protein
VDCHLSLLITTFLAISSNGNLLSQKALAQGNNNKTAAATTNNNTTTTKAIKTKASSSLIAV